MDNKSAKWIILKKDGSVRFYNNKFNFWFLLGAHIPLVLVIDAAIKKLFSRMAIYMVGYWVILFGFVAKLSGFNVLFTVLHVYISIPMLPTAPVARMYGDTFFILLAFHWLFMAFHLFTRKRAILERFLKEGWVIEAVSFERKKSKAKDDLMSHGFHDFGERSSFMADR